MLKEYRFRSDYEYYPFVKNKLENSEYYVNGHKVDYKLYLALFDKVESKIPLDISTVHIWRNNKTGSFRRSFCWDFNEETYDYE